MCSCSMQYRKTLNIKTLLAQLKSVCEITTVLCRVINYLQVVHRQVADQGVLHLLRLIFCHALFLAMQRNFM